MHFQAPESNGPALTDPPMTGPEKSLKDFKHESTTLPFGQRISLSEISGPTYVTAQNLVQQVAYALSDRIWAYSPEQYDLDLAAQDWYKARSHNAYGAPTNVQSLEVRQGAASIALGYVFAKDFDLTRRYIPQSIIASTSALQYLYGALDELSLLYDIAAPFVAHIAALDYAGASSQLVSDYASAITLAEELGFAMLASFSAYESQHMSLFATLVARVLPTMHIYDGVSASRETIRVVDTLSQKGLLRLYQSVQDKALAPIKRRESTDSRIIRLLNAFNEELGTEYGLFEYEGNESPESVLVVFGTVEASLASQVAVSLVNDGANIGVLKVRVCKPFVEDQFLAALPKSVRTIGVLGQVHDSEAVNDSAVRSSLYNDVATCVAFSDLGVEPPTVIDLKYPRETVWTPISIAAGMQLLVKKPLLQERSSSETTLQEPLTLLEPQSVQQYTFWTSDSAQDANVGSVLGQALAKDSAHNVTSRLTYDNLRQGGVIRTDVRRSKKTIEAGYSVRAADVAFIGELATLDDLDVLRSVRSEGKLILRLPEVKDDEVENKLSPTVRKELSRKKLRLYLLDPFAIDSVTEDPSFESYIIQAAFLRIALPSLEKTGLQQLASINGSARMLEQALESLDQTLREIEVPSNWATDQIDESTPVFASDISASGFGPFDKIEEEPPTYLKDWKTPALGLAFKEAYNTRSLLRPDLSQKTYTVRVQENRRLTPKTYDRNIFHIEFDLGDSGLKYDIGEALGIHAENDQQEVEEFMHFYGLNPDEVVEVPSRENFDVLENRTVYQALMQNVDIFGRPPKRFYEALAEFASDSKEAQDLRFLVSGEGASEFKRRAETDTLTYADLLLEFSSAHPSFHDIVRIVSPMKRREYSIASCQKVTPTSVALMIVTVNWTDPRGRDRFGQATRYLERLRPGAPVTVSVKPSVMRLPPSSTQPLIMAGLGTGLAPFRAFVQHRAWEKAQGKEIGDVLLYMGSRHQREEYCYGEEWEAYQDAGVITLLGRAFSRDQPQKIYIQDRMRETLDDIVEAYLKKEGAFYLCKFGFNFSMTALFADIG